MLVIVMFLIFRLSILVCEELHIFKIIDLVLVQVVLLLLEEMIYLLSQLILELLIILGMN
jgi:hypothetical protein